MRVQHNVVDSLLFLFIYKLETENLLSPAFHNGLNEFHEARIFWLLQTSQQSIFHHRDKFLVTKLAVNYENKFDHLRLGKSEDQSHSPADKMRGLMTAV